MNKILSGMIAGLLVLGLGVVSAQEQAKEAAAPQTPAAIVEPAAGTETGEKPSAAAGEPITGAFGLKLGERFDASMVAKVLDNAEHTFRGTDGSEQKGTLYRVEPRQPDERFQSYTVKTTEDGTIYAIQADYQFERKQSDDQQEKAKQAKAASASCKAAVKDLAAELEGRYGKARGKGWGGEWYAFRQVDDNSDKSLRLFGHRCRSGMYYVVYTDQLVTREKTQQQ